MGIEPTLSAWKAEVLPLNYTRIPPPFTVTDNRTPFAIESTHITTI